MVTGIARALRRRWRTVLVTVSAVSAAGVVSAQQPAPDNGGVPPDEGLPSAQVIAPSETPKVKPPKDVPPTSGAATPGASPAAKGVKPATGANTAAAKGAQTAATPTADATNKPPEGPRPIRSPAAIIQALDKVTAETIRFEAPIGKRIRYKTLVFTVKACETTGVDAPQPQAAAYLLVESQPLAVPGHNAPPTKQVYKGWMFSTAPGLHPLEHPVYDAWLIACSASAPPA